MNNACRQKVSEVAEPINRPGFPRQRIDLNNPPGKKKLQAIQSKVTGRQIIQAKDKYRIGSLKGDPGRKMLLAYY